MQSCAIDSRQRLFRCSHHEKKFVSETCEKRSQKYLVSESWGAPSDSVRHVKPRLGQSLAPLGDEKGRFFA